MGRYPNGSIILRTDGYKFIKQMDGRWISEHRLNAQRTIGRDLLEGERVYHKDGNRMNNATTNLAVIRFNLEKFKRLPHTRQIYIPSVKKPKQNLVPA
jgi:hypothetical protein